MSPQSNWYQNENLGYLFSVGPTSSSVDISFRAFEVKLSPFGKQIPNVFGNVILALAWLRILTKWLVENLFNCMKRRLIQSTWWSHFVQSLIYLAFNRGILWNGGSFLFQFDFHIQEMATGDAWWMVQIRPFDSFDVSLTQVLWHHTKIDLQPYFQESSARFVETTHNGLLVRLKYYSIPTWLETWRTPFQHHGEDKSRGGLEMVKQYCLKPKVLFT